MHNELHAKAVQATSRFCERKGYTVLETQWESPSGTVIDLVVDDEGTIAFIDVTANTTEDGGFSNGHTDRSDMEMAAAMYLSEHSPEGDATVRFDICDMIVVSDDRALLRMHTNAFSGAE